jgi:hypothetical protein
VIFDGAFTPTNHEGGVWSLAFPEEVLRRRNLFRSYDFYGSSIAHLRHFLTMDADQVKLNSFTEALLDFDFEGRWLAQMQAKGRYGDRTLRFHFGSDHDLDMMLLFGVRGKVTEK